MERLLTAAFLVIIAGSLPIYGFVLALLLATPSGADESGATEGGEEG